MSVEILVCQNMTCRKAGAAKVLQAFQASLSNKVVQGCGCLGKCGNGPTVLVLPEQAWYYKIHPEQVPMIVQRHLLHYSCCSESQIEEN